MGRLADRSIGAIPSSESASGHGLSPAASASAFFAPRLVHNRRVGGRVRQHQVAELGAISPARLDPADTVEGIVARRAFWRTADAALARFSDRIDASLDETIRAALQSRVPVVTPNE